MSDVILDKMALLVSVFFSFTFSQEIRQFLYLPNSFIQCRYYDNSWFVQFENPTQSRQALESIKGRVLKVCSSSVVQRHVQISLAVSHQNVVPILHGAQKFWQGLPFPFLKKCPEHCLFTEEICYCTPYPKMSPPSVIVTLTITNTI